MKIYENFRPFFRYVLINYFFIKKYGMAHRLNPFQVIYLEPIEIFEIVFLVCPMFGHMRNG